MILMKANECEGCNFYIRKPKMCLSDHSPVDRVEWCPCRECLVKMRCKLGCWNWRESKRLRLGIGG